MCSKIADADKNKDVNTILGTASLDCIHKLEAQVQHNRFLCACNQRPESVDAELLSLSLNQHDMLAGSPGS